jgi:tetratricopeptide (TPR) repeat protein
MPFWVAEEGEEPMRPWSAGWISLKTKLIHMTEPMPPEQKTFETALNALGDFACNCRLAGYRPGKIQVKDPELADYLRDFLAEADILVEQHDKLFTLDETICEMAENLSGKPSLAGALDSKGVTVEAMCAFADAACKFYEAQPWRHLTDEDVIEIDSPRIDASMKFLSVLGAGGMVFGLGFYGSLDQYEAMCRGENIGSLPKYDHWSVLFGPISDLPFGDADLWEEYNLPVAGQDAYPLAICGLRSGKYRRPGPHILAFLEGLMRVLAETKEEELDRGRWQKSSATARGRMEYVLSLPDLIGSDTGDDRNQSLVGCRPPDHRSMETELVKIERLLEEHEFEDVDQINQFLQDNLVRGQLPAAEPQTPLEKAQDLAYQAFESRGRKQLQLVRQALEICPDCADAYVILAERTCDPQQARGLYTQAVAAGRRALGEDFFQDNIGSLWGVTHTRPYMRALFGLAQCLQEIGESDEALTRYRELLRLNPNDNQGVRDILLPFLLELGRDDEAKELLGRYKDDNVFALWAYGRVLLTFRQKGNSAMARKYLDKALAANRYVHAYLLGRKDFPISFADSYNIGSEEEAIIAADLLMNAWESSPGATEWLDSQVRT